MEPYLARWLSRSINNEGIFLDIGVNIGYHTLYIASLFPNVKCICFEPHPYIFQQFVENINLNEYNNIVAYQKAVGDTNGSLDFHMQSNNDYNRGLLPFYTIGISETHIKRFM